MSVRPSNEWSAALSARARTLGSGSVWMIETRTHSARCCGSWAGTAKSTASARRSPGPTRSTSSRYLRRERRVNTQAGAAACDTRRRRTNIVADDGRFVDDGAGRAAALVVVRAAQLVGTDGGAAARHVRALGGQDAAGCEADGERNTTHRVSAGASPESTCAIANERTAVFRRGFVAEAVPRLLHVLAVLPLPAARGGGR